MLQMIDGVKVNPRDDRIVMEGLLELWKKAAQGNTKLLSVAETCPACPGKVGGVVGTLKQEY